MIVGKASDEVVRRTREHIRKMVKGAARRAVDDFLAVAGSNMIVLRKALQNPGISRERISAAIHAELVRSDKIA